MKKNAHIIVIAVLLSPVLYILLKYVFYFVIGVLSLGGVSKPSYDRIDKFLSDNILAFYDAVDLLTALDYEAFSIQETKDGYMVYISNTKYDSVTGEIEPATGGEYVSILDDETINSINELKKIGVLNIRVNRQRTISFSLWSVYNESRGLIYSLSGNEIGKAGQIVDVRSLSTKGWYYYESNWEKWRTLDRHHFDE